MDIDVEIYTTNNYPGCIQVRVFGAESGKKSGIVRAKIIKESDPIETAYAYLKERLESDIEISKAMLEEVKRKL